jgi:hypothetical protein
MKLGTGLHPRHWHKGAWVLALVLIALVLLLTHRPTAGRAFAMEPQQETPGTTTPAPTDPAPPTDDSGLLPPGDPITPPPAEGMKSAPSTPGYVAEIVDSSYTVGPAEFFALDLPMQTSGAKATHLFGTVTTHGRKDIMVRLFRSADYDRWLKQKSGRKPTAFWSSPRSSSLTLDQDLPAGEPVVLLLDNGYSIRTPKKVTCQLQLRYQKGTDTFDTEGGSLSRIPSAATKAPDDNLPTPRSNTDEEMPAPPPPPPSGY